MRRHRLRRGACDLSDHGWMGNQEATLTFPCVFSPRRCFGAAKRTTKRRLHPCSPGACAPSVLQTCALLTGSPPSWQASCHTPPRARSAVFCDAAVLTPLCISSFRRGDLPSPAIELPLLADVQRIRDAVVQEVRSAKRARSDGVEALAVQSDRCEGEQSCCLKLAEMPHHPRAGKV